VQHVQSIFVVLVAQHVVHQLPQHSEALSNYLVQRLTVFVQLKFKVHDQSLESKQPCVNLELVLGLKIAHDLREQVGQLGRVVMAADVLERSHVLLLN
jgi:hypothetical protein